MNLVVLVLLILIIAGVLGAPQLGYHNYGWGPSGGLGLVVLILIILLLLGRI